MKAFWIVCLLAPAWAAAEPLKWGPLTLGIAHQAQYSHLSNQFRAAAPGDDQLLLLRTVLDARLAIKGLRLQLEVADARGYLGDANTPLNTGMINPLDVLSANVGWVQPGVLATDDELRARVGRLTLDVGSRRLLARNIFRNTINAFDGVVVDWKRPKRHAIHLFAVAPVQRLPDTPEGLKDNAFELDAPQFDSWFFGGFGSFTIDPAFRVEGYVYGSERDPAGPLLTPGFRLLRPAKRGALDADFELAVQVGETDGEDHQAAFGHLSFGYTFPVRGLPRVRFMYDWASGDRDPNDGRNTRFDPLFGVARPELGPTGLYTAFTRRNLNAPGIRIQGRWDDDFDGFVDYRFMFLDQASDAWTSSGLRDPTGAAGDAVGRQLEMRFRWHALPKQLTWDSGIAWLQRGDMPKALAPDAGNPFFVYTELVFRL